MIAQADEAEKERALQELEKQREREVIRWLSQENESKRYSKRNRFHPMYCF